MLSFLSVDVFLAKPFLILVFFFVRNNLCRNFSSCMFFLAILDVVPALFFASDPSFLIDFLKF